MRRRKRKLKFKSGGSPMSLPAFPGTVSALLNILDLIQHNYEGEEVLQAIFGDRQARSPAPMMYAVVNTTLRICDTNVGKAVNDTKAAYDAFRATLPDPIYTMPPEWARLLELADAKRKAERAMEALLEWHNAVSNWWANNQGSLTPAGVPPIPDILKDYDNVQAQ
jgi:hypothetical protein